MVVKVQQQHPGGGGGHQQGSNVPAASSSSSQRSAQRVLKKYGLSSRRGPGASSKSGSSSPKDGSYWRLKRLVPAISDKENISKLDVVLEAISYIQALQGNLQMSAPSPPSPHCMAE